MSSYGCIGAVTGANKGIGLAIVRQLALQYPSSTFNTGTFLIYLTARDQNRGESALKSLYEDVELKKAKVLRPDGGLADVKYHHLDISDNNSIRGFADHLKREHAEGVDFVVNNAGMSRTPSHQFCWETGT